MIDTKHRYYSHMNKGKTLDECEAMKPSFIAVLGNRDYTLFATLAGVRNNGITPLFEGRGFPDDVSKACVEEIPHDSDYHSHTWFTVQELLDTDWDAVGMPNGEAILYADQYQAWKETGKAPDDIEEYPWASDDFTREVTEEEMTMLLLSNDLKKLAKRKCEHSRKFKTRSGPYVKVKMPWTYRQLAQGLIETFNDLKKIGDPNKVRIVIAFDN
jgi:hypothetical protein